MKNVKYLLIALMISPIFFINTGCGGDDDVVIVPVDTTPTQATDTPAFGFTVSFQNYQMVLDANQSTGSYRNDIGSTEINLVGYSTKGNAGATITSPAAMELIFQGKQAGVLTEASPGFSFELSTGEGAKLTEYSSDLQNAMTVTIVEYGEVGEMINGSFSGKMKTGINSRDFTKGYFEIERDADR